MAVAVVVAVVVEVEAAAGEGGGVVVVVVAAVAVAVAALGDGQMLRRPQTNQENLVCHHLRRRRYDTRVLSRSRS